MSEEAPVTPQFPFNPAEVITTALHDLEFAARQPDVEVEMAYWMYFRKKDRSYTRMSDLHDKTNPVVCSVCLGGASLYRVISGHDQLDVAKNVSRTAESGTVQLPFLLAQAGLIHQADADRTLFLDYLRQGLLRSAVESLFGLDLHAHGENAPADHLGIILPLVDAWRAEINHTMRPGVEAVTHLELTFNVPKYRATLLPGHNPEFVAYVESAAACWRRLPDSLVDPYLEAILPRYQAAARFDPEFKERICAGEA